ncbi:MAG: LysM peptidoglycan-binding domain-containing protein, partial [Bacteroidales bacterium]|nr:LysM peptidoglycan-binding domain-containing protein [Bacteroidales bacterium]
MRKERQIIFLLVFLLTLSWSCRPSRTIISNRPVPASAREYIDRYSEIAMSEMRRTGVPASITLAQGIIESGNGRSRLAVEGNNHFGIKCHKDWTGPTIRHHDDRRNECFRKYRSAEESFIDHSDFLRNTPRYRFLFDLDPTDYKNWAKGLKKAGYATNPDYAGMLIRKIEEYGLYEYDRLAVSGKYRKTEVKPDERGRNNGEAYQSQSGRNQNENIKSVMNEPSSKGEIVMEKNRIRYIIVKEGDTRASIEKEQKLLKWELTRYNELPDDFEVSPGQILYLQPKRNKAEFGEEYHVVAEGE